jgi:RHS repeat-associated protein
LPFGTPLNAESTGATNRRFTSYDRSATTGLDYANNRHYDPQQGRFTQVDPAGMRAVSLGAPQSLNLYAYCGNDPVNYVDPSGLAFFSFIAKIFRAIKKVLKWVAIVVAVVFVVALTFAILNLPGAQFLAEVFWKMHGLLLKFMAKAGIMHFAEAGGGLTVGLTGQIVGAAMTVGAIANHLQQNRQQDKDKRPPKEVNRIIVREKSREANYKLCVAREWDVFNQNVERVKQAIEDAYHMRELLASFAEILFGMGQRQPSEPGEHLPENPAEGIPNPGPAAALAIQKQREKEEATKGAAENRDRAIAKNCNPLKK